MLIVDKSVALLLESMRRLLPFAIKGSTPGGRGGLRYLQGRDLATKNLSHFNFDASIFECAELFFIHTPDNGGSGVLVLDSVCSVSKTNGAGRDAENKMNGLLVV